MLKRIFALLLALMLLLPVAVAEQTAEEDKWWNILFLGGDSRDPEDYKRTDCMIIISINSEDYLLKMTSLMRDTWVELPGLGIYNKINAANRYGDAEYVLQTVNNCYDTQLEDYVMINMTDLITIIDLIGGIELEIDESERQYINSYAQSYQQEVEEYPGEDTLTQTGLVHLNGLLAVSHTRNRYTDSDFGRVMRQQEVLLAMARRFQNMEVDELMGVVDEIFELIATNLEKEEMEQLAKIGLLIYPEEVEQFRLPVDGTFTRGMYEGTYSIRPDFEANARLLKEFIYGPRKD